MSHVLRGFGFLFGYGVKKRCRGGRVGVGDEEKMIVKRNERRERGKMEREEKKEKKRSLSVCYLAKGIDDALMSFVVTVREVQSST